MSKKAQGKFSRERGSIRGMYMSTAIPGKIPWGGAFGSIAPPGKIP